MSNVKEKEADVKIHKKKNKKIVYIALLLIIIYVIYTVYLLVSQPTSLFTVEKGKLYVEESNVGYIIRDEIVIKGENYKNGMEQIIAEGERTSKEESVFRYYSQNEEELKQKISQLDEKIQTAMNEAQGIISSSIVATDIQTIENKIDEKVKDLNKLTDMSEITEYKKQIAYVASKKAQIVGEASKQGSYLKQLIGERGTLESQLNSGAEYVNATKSGIVSYRVDRFRRNINTFKS